MPREVIIGTDEPNTGGRRRRGGIPLELMADVGDGFAASVAQEDAGLYIKSPMHAPPAVIDAVLGKQRRADEASRKGVIVGY